VKRSSGRREFDPAPGPLEEARAAFAEHVCDRRPPRCVEAASQLTGTRTLLIAMLDPTGEEFVIGDHAVTMYGSTLAGTLLSGTRSPRRLSPRRCFLWIVAQPCD
jgi:hypothetical protein